MLYAKSLEQLQKKLREKISQSGKSDAQIARTAGLSPSQLSRIFDQNANPTLKSIVAIAEAVGVTPADLIMNPQNSPTSAPNLPQDIVEALSQADDFELEAVRAVLGIRRKGKAQRRDEDVG